MDKKNKISLIDFGLERVGVDILDQTPHDKLKSAIIKEINKFSQKSGFTLTINASKVCKFVKDVTDPKELHRYIHNKIVKSRVWKKIKFVMFPEFSTINGNLHYHGIIYDEYQTVVMKCIKWWRRNFGFAKPELEIRHYDNWMNYITKDINKTGLWTIYNTNIKNAQVGESAIYPHNKGSPDLGG